MNALQSAIEGERKTWSGTNKQLTENDSVLLNALERVGEANGETVSSTALETFDKALVIYIDVFTNDTVEESLPNFKTYTWKKVGPATARARDECWIKHNPCPTCYANRYLETCRSHSCSVTILFYTL